MVKINLIIADPDLAYLKAIDSYFSEHYSHRFHIFLYSHGEALAKRTVMNVDGADILLVNPKLLTEEIESVYEGKIILLSEGRLGQHLDQYPSIFKYQRGDMLAADILQNLSLLTNDVTPLQVSTRSAKLGLFYSAEGGAGKTTLALALGSLLAGMGKEVLYLNFEIFPSTELYFDCQRTQQGGQLYYYMKGDQKQLKMKLEGLRLKDPSTQLNYYPPAEVPSEFNEITPDELRNFIHEVQKSGLYDYVLIDVSSSFDDKIETMLELSDSIVLLINDTPGGKSKTEILFKMLEVNDFHKDKMILCYNRVKDLQALEETKKDLRLYLPSDPSLLIKRGAFYQINLNSLYVKSLKGLVESFVNL